MVRPFRCEVSVIEGPADRCDQVLVSLSLDVREGRFEAFPQSLRGSEQLDRSLGLSLLVSDARESLETLGHAELVTKISITSQTISIEHRRVLGLSPKESEGR